MKIIIKSVIKQELGYKIEFFSEYGNATGFWNGVEPQIDNEYFVEIEVPRVLYWKKEINTTDEKCKIEELDNGKVYLSGVLESVEEDGYAILRMDNNIISIETNGIPPIIGSYIKIAAIGIVLYEVNF